MPRLTTAAIGAKNGVGWPKTSLASTQATPAAIAHWAICHDFARSRARRARSEVRLRATASSKCGAAAAAVARQVLPRTTTS